MFAKRIFLLMQDILNCNTKAIAESATAAIQKGTAYSIKNKKGIPARVMPNNESTAMSERQRLWQICQFPSKLAKPEIQLVKAASLSFGINCMQIHLNVLLQNQ